MAGSVNVGSADVTIVPDAQGFSAKLSAQITPEAKALGENLGKLIGDAIQQRIQSGIQQGLGPNAQTRTQGTRQGTDYAGSFATAFRTRIEQAMRALPEIKLTANSTDAEVKLQGIRAQLDALSKQRIGVDIDEEVALTELDRLKVKLEELNSDSPSIQVKADTAAALAQLELVLEEVRRVGAERPTVEVNADTAGAQAQLASLGSEASAAGGGFSGLIAAGVALGPALIPVIAAVAAAAAGLVGVLGSLGVGAGVLALGFHGIAAGVQALDKQQSRAAASGRSAASSAIQMGNANRQVEAAERSLANTRANAADAAIRSAEQVKNAKQSEKDAEVQAAQASQQAEQQYVQASAKVVDAVRTETDAQNALVEARKTAAQQLEDLANQVIDGQNQQREATFGVADAQAALTAAQALDPTGSNEATQKAQLAYDEAVQRLHELQIQNQRLADQKAAADKAGVDGSQVVTQAQRQLQQATQGVTDAQKAQADAAKNVANVQVQGAEKVQKAQQQVTDAIRAQVTQQRQSAQSIAQAIDAVAAAQSSVASANLGGGGGGIAKQASAFDKLTPAGKAFARFVHDELMPAFKGLQEAAAKGLLPGVEQGLKLLLPVLPGVATFVGKVASALGSLFVQGVKALKDPFWTGFFSFAAKQVIPILKGTAQFVGDLARGFAGLLRAFAPITGTIGGGMLGLADSFAKFGEQAGKPGSPFQSFLGYVEKYAPLVGQFFKDLFEALGNIVEVAAPFGAMMLGLIDYVLKLINHLGPTGLAFVLLGVGAAMAVLAGPISAVITGLSLMAAGAIYLYTHMKPVHDFIDQHILPIFHQLSDYFTNTVYPILKKIGGEAMEGIRAGLQIVGDAIAKHKPQLDEIGSSFKELVDFIVKHVVPTLGPILKIAFEGVGAFAAGLIDIIATVVTAFDDLPNAAERVWNKIQNYFADGVNAVIDVINIFVRALDKLPGVSIGQLSKVGHPAPLPSSTTSGQGSGLPGGKRGFATGGVLPGYAPGVDSVMAMLSPGEGVLVPEAVQMLGPSWVHAVNAYASRNRAGVRRPGHFSIGGIVDSIGSGISTAVGAVGGVLAAPERAAVNAAISTAKHFANDTIPAGFFRDVADSSLDKIGNALKFADGGIVGSAWSPLLAGANTQPMSVDGFSTQPAYEDHRSLTVVNHHRPLGPADLVQGWNQHDAIHGRPLMAGAGLGVG